MGAGETKLTWTYALLKLYVDANDISGAYQACDNCIQLSGNNYPQYSTYCAAYKQSLNGYSSSANRIGRVRYSGKGAYLDEIINAADLSKESNAPYTGDDFEILINRRLPYPSNDLSRYVQSYTSFINTDQYMVEGPFILVGYKYEKRTYQYDGGQQVIQQRQVEMQRPMQMEQTKDPMPSQRNSTEPNSFGYHNQLKDLLAHLKSTYGVSDPDYYIPVYFSFADMDAGGYEEFSEFAVAIHGRGAGGRVAYFNPIDLSVVCWIETGTGTLSHETVHSVILQDYPDIPGWLNEGFAAMFEESDGGYEPADNYRLIYVNEAKKYNKSISIEGLITATRDQFDASKETMLYAATARYFVMFLRDKKWLPSIYGNLKYYEVSDPTNVGKTIVQVTGYNLTDLNRLFNAWLTDQNVPYKWSSLQPDVEQYIRQL
tara:strand:+ start:1755 stop:3044 length:1290 start_codon:yes stop_codon:yes gene_type:complete